MALPVITVFISSCADDEGTYGSETIAPADEVRRVQEFTAGSTSFQVRYTVKGGDPDRWEGRGEFSDGDWHLIEIRTYGSGVADEYSRIGDRLFSRGMDGFEADTDLDHLDNETLGEWGIGSASDLPPDLRGELEDLAIMLNDGIDPDEVAMSAAMLLHLGGIENVFGLTPPSYLATIASLDPTSVTVSQAEDRIVLSVHRTAPVEAVELLGIPIPDGELRIEVTAAGAPEQIELVIAGASQRMVLTVDFSGWNLPVTISLPVANHATDAIVATIAAGAEPRSMAAGLVPSGSSTSPDSSPS